MKVYQQKREKGTLKSGITFLLRFHRSLLLEKNSDTYHLLVMANLPPIFILTLEVAMRIDRKCQKGVHLRDQMTL